MLKSRLLIFGIALSAAGDMLFAFFWNTQLIPKYPSLALATMGGASIFGLAVASILGKYLRKRFKPYGIILVGSIFRLISTFVFLQFFDLFAEATLINFAGIVFFVDLLVGVVSSGLADILISAALSRDEFISIQGFRQWVHKSALLVALIISPFLLKLGVRWLLLIDVLSFVPIVFIILKFKSFELKQSNEGQGNLFWQAALRLGLPILVVTWLGGLVSKTSPLLWSNQISNAFLISAAFGFYLFGSILSGYFFGKTLIQSIIKTYDHNLIFLRVTGVTVGITFFLLPFVRFNIGLFLSLILLSGLLCGALSLSLMSLVRQTFEGPKLNNIFLLSGLIGYWMMPVSDLSSSLILAKFPVEYIYFLTGTGFILFSLIFFRKIILNWWNIADE
jgi:hypothetical protein